LYYHKNKHPKKILEIGCGTGFLTQLISNSFEFEEYLTIDIVEECREYINQINSTISFLPIDIEEFIKTNTEK